MDYFKTAMDALGKRALHEAEHVVGGKIGWHGEEAVAVALLNMALDNLMDDYNADPEEYVDRVNAYLAGRWSDG